MHDAADLAEDRLHASDVLVAPARHDREAALGDAVGPARDGRVDPAHPFAARRAARSSSPRDATCAARFDVLAVWGARFPDARGKAPPRGGFLAEELSDETAAEPLTLLG